MHHATQLLSFSGATRDAAGTRKALFTMNVSWILSFLLLLVFVALSSSETRSPRVVTTRSGKLRGVIRALNNKHLRPVEVFLGVPYATPPTGSNRFSPTRTPSPWTGERLAAQYGPVCPQRFPDIWDKSILENMPEERLEHLRKMYNYMGNQAEDCLYLNIYVPSLVADTKGHKALSVLIFIHGESFEWGSSTPYDGSVLAAYGEVIVVTLNYRLGPLGFLNTNSNPNSRSHVMNHGLMDQIAALHWVQENIGAFGGDPGSVTLLGHDTGAACIQFLMVSSAVVPGLFHRAILMSGSALSSWAKVSAPAYYALQFGKDLNCTVFMSTKYDLREQKLMPSSEEFDQMVNCLKDKTLEELKEATTNAPRFLYAFGPSIDGIVIKNDFSEEVRKRIDEVNKGYDIMFGVVPQESYNDLSDKDIKQGFNKEKRDNIFRTLIRNTYDYHLNEVFISVVNEYTDWERSESHPTSIRDSTLDALSDGRYVAPLIETAQKLSIPDKSQYFYVFNHRKSQDLLDVKGSLHGQELPFAFGAPLVGQLGVFSSNWTDMDSLISEAFLSYLTNFAKTGNTNLRKDQEFFSTAREKNLFKSVSWEKYDSTYQRYLEIGPRPASKDHYRAHQLAVWTWLVPQLQKVGRLEFLTLHDKATLSEDGPSEEKLQELSVLHHLFTDHEDLSIYWGPVRPLEHMAGHYIIPSTTSVAPTTTPLIYQTSSTFIPPKQRGSMHEMPNTTVLAEATMPEDAVEYVTYSTALTVTVAIGVSLLILNILIFAGVYYQRDRIRVEDKHTNYHNRQHSPSSSEQQMTAISGSLAPSFGSNLALDVTKSSNIGVVMAPQPPSPLTHVFTHISECPPAFADVPSSLQDDSHKITCTNVPLPNVPNGSATIVGSQAVPGPRPPPPPRLSPSESQPLLPVSIPAPPRGKVPPYEELRV